MSMSVIEAHCFGSSISPLFVWLLAADVAAMNASFGRHHPARLWWSVPYAVGATVWTLASYLPEVAVSINPYETVTRLTLDARWFPAYVLVVVTLVAPVAGLAQRAARGQQPDRDA